MLTDLCNEWKDNRSNVRKECKLSLLLPFVCFVFILTKSQVNLEQIT